MKKLLLLLFVLLGSVTVHAKETIIVLVSSQDVFYFQVGKLMKGGQVEIYDPAGKLITTQQITSRKMTIEVLNLSPGEYTMKVVKRSEDQRFDLADHSKAQVAMRDEVTISLKLEAQPRREIAIGASEALVRR